MEILRLKTSRPFFSFIYREFILHKGLLIFKIISVYLIPFSLFYLAVIYLKKCFIRKSKLTVPVISVGNITAGGTGKTPLVMYIADFYHRKGRNVTVASSGAEKSNKGYLKIKPYDETLMIKKNLSEIKLTGKRAKEICKGVGENSIVVLDDGFHCYHLYKDIEIVVIDMANPFDNNMLLPAGLLREPKRELKRADIFVLSHPYMVDNAKKKNIINYFAKFHKPVCIMDYNIEFLGNETEKISPDFIRNSVILAFTGTGNPLNFFAFLSSLSPKKTYGIVYPDHFRYHKKDIKELEDIFLKKRAEYIITTEKDYVKISNYRRTIPVFYLKIKPVLKGIDGTDFDTFLYNIV